ncbi:casein kinase substrate phosphoprotein pp28 [Diplodia corticola]|uniref:Mediator of RNA polymerase II transcription subunit 11 n=1 Tax=Diplodia corticola TaxID=236234 RepID=A0A1J9S3X0_9PEZI|nr:casein kinase substrate phosphoprotein pp28 [Diplodia corticola]OJD34684.1 casein kinase substrate phosphoprotein pp28 [Diplodia corticola]
MSADAYSNDVAAEHIQELSKIKEDVPKLLTAASHAINALTNRPLASDDPSPDPSSNSTSDPLAARKEAYQTHTRTYFTLVREISNNLSREIGALEDAGVIPAKAERVEQAQKQQQRRQRDGGGGGAGAEVKNGGLGELDVGWLNARTRDVGVGKAGELVAEARRRLEERRKSGAQDADVSME